MTNWQTYLKLLHYLCNRPSFDKIIPIAGTRSINVSSTSEVVQGVGKFTPSGKKTWEEFVKDTSIQKEVFPPLYLVYQLNISGSNETISFLALPVIVDCVDLESGNYNLKPNCDLSVLFNPNHLHSEGKSEPEWVLGDELKYRNFKSGNLSSTTDDWSSWHKSAMQMVETVTGKSLFELEYFLGNDSTFNFRLDTQLAIYSDGDNAAIRNTLQLYDALFNWDEGLAQKTPLYKAIKAHEGEPPTQPTEKDSLAEDIRAHKSYFLGHMDEQNSHDFKSLSDRKLDPLDNSQRIVLQKLSLCEEGDAIAVNGPPGSGKTAMLKAVIADQWVRAALYKKPCPIILAVGATNQSVKNIISAFPKVLYSGTEPPPSFLMHYNRWIPHLKSYGTYFPASTELKKIKESDRAKDIVLGQISSKDSPNVLEWLEDNEAMSDFGNLKAIKDGYIDMASLHFKKEFEGELSPIIDACHLRLARLCQGIEEIIESATRENLKDITWVNNLLDSHPLLPGQKSKELLHSRKQAKEMAHFLITLCSSNRNDHEKILLEIMRERIFDEQIALSKLNDSDYDELLYDARVVTLDRLLDVTFRAEAFHYTARYWEGVYIAECSQELLIARTKDNVEKGLRRACMLTPCLVSTLNSAPNLFRLVIARNRFLLGKVDLLIMDESGQAQQRIGIPLLALAKKALIVGDVQQLQPVITDITLGDEADAYMSFGYTKQEFMAACENKVTSTNGSILQLMRRASSFSHQGLGLMLRGHYRCQSNIIQFCNEMVYDNKLMLMPHNHKERGPFPSFSWVHSNFKNGKEDSSRFSLGEANAMIDFLLNRWESIYNFYRKEDEKNNTPHRTASGLIAIVTPFKAQANRIRQILEARLGDYNLEGFCSKDIAEMKIGTVDSLQGAEKPIVLFSGVHGALDKGEPYFKDQPFLLNVAVSRAQDCFVAFICEETYGVVNQVIKPELLPQVRKNSVRYLGYYLGSACKENGVRRCERLFPKRLVIIEATGKVKSLGNFLGPRYLILDSKGSITDYSDQTSTFDQLVATGFKPKFTLKPNGTELIEAIKAQLSSVDEVILATDDDYVGETIAWHIYMQFLNDPDAQNKFTRVRLGAITPDEVSRAFKINEAEAHDVLVRALPADQVAKKRQEFLQLRDKIDLDRVKAELFRELIDNLVRDQLKKLPVSPTDEILAAKATSYDLVGKVSGRANPKAMGRVKIAILSLLAKDVQSNISLIDKNHCNIYLHVAGKGLLGHVESNNDETKDMLNRITKHQDSKKISSYKGDDTQWRIDLNPFLTMSAPPPDASTMEIIKLSATQLRIKPNITMQILQALYIGDF